MTKPVTNFASRPRGGIRGTLRSDMAAGRAVAMSARRFKPYPHSVTVRPYVMIKVP
jgi:hypothetical protein